MKRLKNKLEPMIAQVDAIIEKAQEEEAAYQADIQRVHAHYRQSARNLIHYRAMRQLDIRDLQKQLGNMGFSRLAKSEGHVMASLFITRNLLKSLLNKKPLTLPRNQLSPRKGRKLLNTNAKALLGKRSRNRRTRIMVTLPSEAAHNYELVHQLVASGMNCARINCAHDTAEEWASMIEHLERAKQALKRSCHLCMDLAGPKIRTGPVEAGPKAMKIKTRKNELGETLEPVRVWLSPHLPEYPNTIHLPISEGDLNQLEAGMKLSFRDLRDRKRRLIVQEKTPKGCWALVKKTTYVSAGTPLYIKADQAPILIGELTSMALPLILRVGDQLHVHADPRPGQNAQFQENGTLIAPAHISCTSQEVFAYVKAGERVLFDDGKIETVIREHSDTGMLVEVTHARETGSKLRPDKGINFPDSDLAIHGLTAKDKEDLRFVAAHANVVNMSFVNRPEDVHELIDELAKLEAVDRLGIILKIETRKGFQRLTSILLAAMRTTPVGVMIARGDLAIECGWEQIGRIQEEILWLCQAAHIPDIWATQVLENLAKTGLPSRAEITDATMSQRAECVMLNKGPYILRAIRLLDTILENMGQYQEKKAPMLPAMED